MYYFMKKSMFYLSVHYSMAPHHITNYIPDIDYIRHLKIIYFSL